MTLNERIEAAAHGIRDYCAEIEVATGGKETPDPMLNAIAYGLAALRHAFPELFTDPPTAWIAPWELDDRLAEIASNGVSLCHSLEPGEGFDENPGVGAFEAVRDSFIPLSKIGGKGNGDE